MSKEEAYQKLVKHLTDSGKHMMPKDEAIAIADAQRWAYHDQSDEEHEEPEVKSEQESPPPTRPASPAPERRERSPRRRRSSASSSTRGITLIASSNLLAMAPIGARSSRGVEPPEAWRHDFARCMEVVESGIRNLRHAERLSSAVAVAFASEAIPLENPLLVMRNL